MSRPPGAGRRLPPASYTDRGPLPAQHSPAIQHMADVAGPPAPPTRAPDAPLAGPTTTRPAPADANPPQSVNPVSSGGGRRGPGPGRNG